MLVPHNNEELERYLTRLVAAFKAGTTDSGYFNDVHFVVGPEDDIDSLMDTYYTETDLR